MKEPCVIFVASSVSEANTVKSLLESSGIEVFIYDEHFTRIMTGGFNPHGIRLLVPESQAVEAKRILEMARRT